MYRDPHSLDQPAPAYAIESDDEDDLWNDGINPVTEAHTGRWRTQHVPEPKLEWTDGALVDPDDSGSVPEPAAPTLWVFIGDAGAFVAGGIAPDATSSGARLLARRTDADELAILAVELPYSGVDTSPGPSLVLVPAHASIDLQNPTAMALLARYRPSQMKIVARYSAPNYMPRSSLDDAPVRWLASSGRSGDPADLASGLSKLSLSAESNNGKGVACAKYEQPNLITGTEAALVAFAAWHGIPASVIFLPSLAPSSISASFRLSEAAPYEGLYDNAPSSAVSFPSLLPLPHPREFTAILKAMGWQLPWDANRAHQGAGRRIFERAGLLKSARQARESDGMYI